MQENLFRLQHEQFKCKYFYNITTIGRFPACRRTLSHCRIPMSSFVFLKEIRTNSMVNGAQNATIRLADNQTVLMMLN